MIVWALLTSVGINLGLCLLFFTLYSILKKQPSYLDVYAPRLVAAKEESEQRNGFNFERLLPTAGWVKRAWQPSEDEFMSATSFDAVVFIRIFIFSLRVFGFAGIVGVVILLPINYLGTQLDADSSDLANKSLDSFSISNVKDGSKWLWVHFCAVYIFSGVVCYLLYYEYSYISSKRIAHYYSSKPQPHQFTILVRGIPVSSGSSCSETVEKFFTEYYPSTYLSHSVVRRTNKLQRLTSDAKKLYRRLVHLKSETNPQRRSIRDGFCGLFGHKVNVLDHYGKKLETLEDNVRMEQLSVAGKASFFIAYVVTSGWTSLLSSVLFRLSPLICSIIKKPFSGKDGDELKVPSIPYHSHIPKVLFFGLLGITYFFLAPLIIPFLLVYCCLGYIIYRNQLLIVYAPKYDTGGRFWPTVHNSTIFSLVLMHIIAIGIFGLKNLSLASSLIVPLPILTLLFNEYCRKRFLPIFEDYPLECLIKKDRQDQNDPTIAVFYNKLSTAYEDPALMPIRHPRSTDDHNSPLLQAGV
ncbi:hypothetical protein PRUPE_3G263100 [Prunus persica]|uniref:CSC1/OSCA1-like 7TM region domain-containing protein n=1 Tax=Prunus persica TaxID=3760 RepID=A0A251Q5R1_PRUPE|nr:hypothetical protein PRUPE_3G263100 [Prunus persica]